MQIERLLVSKKELKTIGIPYSPQHIARLEKANSFPKRIALGQCRVAWCYNLRVDRRTYRSTRFSRSKLTITPEKGALRGLPVQPSVPFFSHPPSQNDRLP